MAAILDNGKLTLSGNVGDLWFGDYFTYGDVLLALAQIDAEAPLTVHINSGGGIATEGAAIHALFSGRPGTTNFVVEGIAASAASLIVMAGDTVTMAAGSVLMIHDPASWTFGTVDEHNKTVAGLEALATAYARVYADKSGKTAAECRAIMKAERWYAPEEAVADGFADETAADKADAVAAFDYRAYAHAPQKLTALAKRKNWTLAEARPKGAPVASAHPQTTQPNKEPPVADNTNGGAAPDNSAAITNAVAADRQRRRDIMALEETKGRESLASYYAEETDDAVEKVKAALSHAPKGGAPSGGNGGNGGNGSSTQTTTGATAFQQRVMNAEGLNGGGDGPRATGDRSILSAAADARNKRR